MFQFILPDKAVPPFLRNGVVGIGNFDGVHRGHQAVLTRAIEIARAKKSPALALTFEPHPRDYFKPEAPVFRLTPQPEKLLLLGALSLDGAVVRNFDAKLAGMTPQEFFEMLLVRELEVKHLVVGEDFHFGKDRAGTPQVLQELAQRAGIEISFIKPQRDGEVISSSRIRGALSKGDIANAQALLGYRWFISGKVIHGDKRGRLLGVPTANIVMPKSFAFQHGVYAGRACADGFWFAAAIHYGARVQFGGGPPLLEAHLLDFSGDLYGKTLRVEFMEFLRGEEKFENAEALAAQMRADIEQARKTVTVLVKKPQTALQTALDQACESDDNP